MEMIYAITLYVSIQCLTLLGSQVLANIMFPILYLHDYP